MAATLRLPPPSVTTLLLIVGCALWLQSRAQVRR